MFKNLTTIVAGTIIGLATGPAIAQSNNVPQDLDLIIEMLVTLQDSVADLQSGAEDSQNLLEPKTLFTTSTLHKGDLGGLGGADAICQGLADAPGSIVPAGVYVALLSTIDVQASGRITHTAAPYIRPDGAPIAANSAALFGCGISGDCTLDLNLVNAPSVDETGAPQLEFVWTGSDAGGLYASNANCIEWTSDDFPVGRIGLSPSVSEDWLTRQNSGCEIERALYCAQR